MADFITIVIAILPPFFLMVIHTNPNTGVSHDSVKDTVLLESNTW